MRHLSLVVLSGDLEPASRAIARVGVLHLLDVRHSVETLGAIRPYDISERLTQLNTLERRLDGILKVLGLPAPEEAVSDDLAGELDLQALAAQTDAVAAEVESLRARVTQVTEETEALQQLVRKVRALAPLGFPLQDLRGLRYVHVAAGLLSERNLPRLHESLARVPNMILASGPPDSDGRVMISALCLRQGKDAFELALRAAQFERVELPAHLTGTPDEVMAQMDVQLAASRGALAAAAADRDTLAQRLGPAVQSLRAVVERERLLVQARGLMGRSERITLITGWVPAVLTGTLEQAMRAAAAGRYVIQWREPAALEAVRRGRVPVPILLHNPVLIRPFERLLRNYGLPRYGEVEPTPVVALGFLVMFGFMFGDVGHGAVLFAGGYFIYRRMFRYRDYAVILMECGVFAMAFGFLYGGVFGVEHWLPALWLRPMHDMARLMTTALLFGIAFLSLAMGLNLVNALRRHDPAALWERNGLLAALAYWVAVGLFVRRLTAGPGAVPVGTAVMWLAVPVGVIFLKDPVLAFWKAFRQHRWPAVSDVVESIVQSMVEVLDTAVSTISNTATFIRLAAFALSHAGLFLATFSVADAVRRTSAGSLGAAAVLVLGNIVIIALEGLIVSIQSIRLEYYEFFSRFYSGGGEEYRPLRLASSHP